MPAVSFKSVFIAVVLGTAIVVAALLINAKRPPVETAQPSAELVRATGKCAECHRRETSAVVHQFERSQHAVKGINCLDCHKPAEGQEAMEHRGFTLAKHLTAKNCAQCHTTEYEQFARSRHAGPSWAAVRGTEGFSPEQIALGEKFHPGWIKRPTHPVGVAEGESAMAGGCDACHAIGKPNADGSFGSCTQCHARHSTSVALAREPRTCGQCHMGPDHSQIEIFEESKHGVLFTAQRESFNLKADPKHLTTADMPAPTCSTCHMSGLEGLKVTHNPGERLGWFLFAPISTRRPAGDAGEQGMKEVCLKCHAHTQVESFYTNAEAVLQSTNEKVKGALDLTAALRKEGLIDAKPFDQPIKFVEFDLWHYFGRTAKHAAFMGGADFVQWHGNYELLKLRNELDTMAKELREGHGGAPVPKATKGTEAKP
ncbi:MULTISPECIES: multiheme c-type cytochrome [Myxococcaceae]|uniref:multiheme c-type cytochrome n=1 Tax=Myxococcaceae TaxID=31 RepID=UPI00188E9F01|nr:MULTISPECIES: multiheme c-type cytochrome [Myxococcaceae]MBF5045384.1 nitrate reductase [Simulacricoccus sp. 17bor-14]